MQHDVATQQLGNAQTDGQAQAGAPVLAAGAGVDLFEGVEDVFEFFGGNADAGVDDADGQQWLAGEFFRQRKAGIGPPDVDADAAVHRELERVADQVVGDLLQPGAVGAQHGRNVGVDGDVEIEFLFLRHVTEGAPQGALEVGQRQVVDDQFHLARFDLGQVQDVVDQPQQVAAGVVDDARRFDLLVVQVAGVVVGQAARQDQQAVQRRAQLVRHVGQEIGLVLAGAGQFLGLVFGVQLQVFEHLALPVQAVGLVAQLLVRRLQLLRLHPQFLFGHGQPLRLLFQLQRLDVQRLVALAQYFLLLAHQQFRRAQIVGLLLAALQQLLRIDGAAEVFLGQRNQRQQFGQQLHRRAGDRLEAGQLQYAGDLAAVQDGLDHHVRRQGFTTGRMHPHISRGHLIEHDQRAFLQALAHQAVTGCISLDGTGRGVQAIGAAQFQSLVARIVGVVHRHAGLQQRCQVAGQRLAELTVGGGFLQVLGDRGEM